MLIRKSHCTQWYPEKTDEIWKYIPEQKDKIKTQVLFGVVPHAGWVYSGKVAGSIYSLFPSVNTVIFVATNHTGLGPPSSIFPEGEWEMSHRRFSIDKEFTDQFIGFSKQIKPDVEAHLYEHAIEVQLPFLEAVSPECKIVPIEMRDYRWEICLDIGQSIARTIERTIIKKDRDRIAVIASSDMTHCGAPYGQPQPENVTAGEYARRQDSYAIEQIAGLNSKNLLNVVKEKNVTMCGSGPVAAIIEAAKSLGKTRGHLVQYATSADVSGKDSEIAVGYAGIIFE